jgi:hypothetical protein
MNRTLNIRLSPLPFSFSVSPFSVVITNFTTHYKTPFQ